MPYIVSIDATVLDNYSAAPGQDRIEFRKAIAVPAGDPYLSSDRRVRSAAGREYERRRFSRWLITYWSDHAVQEVRIVDAERLVR